MKQSRLGSNTSALIVLIAVVLVTAVLYFARVVLIPIALAVLLSFLLGPLVNRLQKVGIGRVLSVGIVTCSAFAVIGLLGWVLLVQVIDLAERLPSYKDNIREKIHTLRGKTESVFGRASETIEELSKEVSEPASTQASTQPATRASMTVTAAAPETPLPPGEPMPVELIVKPPSALQTLQSTTTPLLDPLLSAGIVILFVIVMLIQRENLRDRMVYLAGRGRVTLTTRVIDDAAQRISRYLQMLFIVNATYGVAVTIGLLAIGIENAVLWGVLAMVLRFIPYAGPWIAAAMPITLSLAAYDDWTHPMMVAGLFIVIELLSNNVMEPLVYGSQTGLSPMAVILAAVFWGWLWGPIGLVLAMPLTLLLVVIGRHVPQMEFLAILLGDSPAIPLESRVYQRLLATDEDEAFELASMYLKEHTLEELYQDVLLKVLAMAERDRHHGELEPADGQRVFKSLRALITDLGESAKQSASAERDEPSAEPAAPTTPIAQPCAYLLPASDEADETAALMLAQLLELKGACATVATNTQLTAEQMDGIESANPDFVCISAMPPFAMLQARYLCKRLASRFPNKMVIVGLWGAVDLNRVKAHLPACGPDRVVGSFASALERLRK